MLTIFLMFTFVVFDTFVLSITGALLEAGGSGAARSGSLCNLSSAGGLLSKFST